MKLVFSSKRSELDSHRALERFLKVTKHGPSLKRQQPQLAGPSAYPLDNVVVVSTTKSTVACHANKKYGFDRANVHQR